MSLGQGQTPPRGVSVVIPTLNRELVLMDTVRDLFKQEFDNWELIIVDQSNKVNCVLLELLRESPVPARYFKAQFRGLPQARNFGWRQATKEIVLYIDDDIRCSKYFLRAHYDAHMSYGAKLIAGGVDENGLKVSKKRTGQFHWWTATPVANFGASKSTYCLHPKGCNFSITTDLLSKVGGFDEALTLGAALYEELEMALRVHRLGEKAWFEESARLTHLAAPSGGCRVANDWPRYMHGLAHNRAILIFRHLCWWHRPTALLRLLLLGLSYSRLDRSWRPLVATFRGVALGRLAARNQPLNAELQASECTSC